MKKFKTVVGIFLILTCIVAIGGQFEADASNSIYCPECGRMIDSDSNFCKYCGYHLKEQFAQLPDNVSVTMHLDVNNSGGYVRGLGQKNNMYVNQRELAYGEYCSPSLVVWNDSRKDVQVRISYVLNGKSGSWESTTVRAGSNLAFRANANQLKGITGQNEIIWYYNGDKAGTFSWYVG